jgi:hypothetical protein
MVPVMSLSPWFGDDFDPREVTTLVAAFDKTCSALERHEQLGRDRRAEVAAHLLRLARDEGTTDSDKLATMAVTGISARYNVLRSIALPSR